MLLARLAFAELGSAVAVQLHGEPERVASLRVTGRTTASPEEHALAQAIARRATDRARSSSGACRGSCARR